MELAAGNPFTAILEDGETILWIGEPDKDLHDKEARKIHRFFGFGLLALLAVAALLGTYEGLGLVGISLVLGPLGVGLCFATASVPRWHYAVTNKRVLFYNPTDEGEVTTQLAFHQISTVWLRSKDKSGCSVVFDAKPPFKKIRFDYVADVAEVQELVVSLLTGVRLEEARE